MDKNVQIGSCHKVHGIRGGFHFRLIDEAMGLVKKGDELLIEPLNNSSLEKAKVFTVEKISYGNKTLCYLKNIADRNEAEGLVPFQILVSRDYFPELKSGEHYIFDVEGLKVFDDKSGEELGVVESYYDNGAHKVLVIGKLEIPFVEAFIKEVDIEEKVIRVVNPEYI